MITRLEEILESLKHIDKDLATYEQVINRLKVRYPKSEPLRNASQLLDGAEVNVMNTIMELDKFLEEVTE